MIIRSKSEFSSKRIARVFINVILYHAQMNFRLWKEIQTNAKIELLHVLWMSRIALADGHTIASIDEISAETFFKDEPSPKVVLKRWKFIIDMFVENGFI